MESAGDDVGKNFRPDLLVLEVACRDAVDGPLDMPNLDKALRGMALSLDALVAKGLLPATLPQGVLDTIPSSNNLQAPGAALAALTRRKRSHLIYSLCIEVADRAHAGKPLGPVVLAALGAWLVCRLICAWSPSPSALARVRAALTRPEGRSAEGWSAAARLRGFIRASELLAKTSSENPQAASAFGLVAKKPEVRLSCDPISVFNRAFRRRINRLRNHSTKNARAGASGYGNRSVRMLRRIGVKLMNQVNTGDVQAIFLCLESVSHQTAGTIELLPVKSPEVDISEALAWIDFEVGAYSYRLFHLDERGSRPTSGTENLYESTSQIVTIFLPPFLLSALRRLVEKSGHSARTMKT